MKRIIALTLCMMVLVVFESLSATLYVDDDGVCGGSSPCNTNIQIAVSASFPGDVVQVYPGTYNESVWLVPGVSVVGFDPEQTFLNGGSSVGVYAFTPGSESYISGFTISGDPYSVSIGANSITRIYGNIITNYGQIGIFCGSSDAIIENNYVDGKGIGGNGVYVVYSSPRIIRNSILNNTHHGIVCEYASPVVDSNLIKGNQYSGLWIYPDTQPNITNNIVTDNTYGLYVFDNSTANIVNNTISNNRVCGVFLDNALPVIANNSVTHNVIAGIYCEGLTPSFITNNVWAQSNNYYGCPPGASDISVDPKYLDLANGNFSLQPGAPNVDAGNNAFVPGWLLLDFEGENRIADGDSDGEATVDIGAYELNELVITLDIRPGDFPNYINLHAKSMSKGKSAGKVPVAVLGSVDFDVNNIVLSTVTFAGATCATKGNVTKMMSSVKDVNFDGLDDLVLHFEIRDLSLNVWDTMASIIGRLNNGMSFSGNDVIVIAPD